MLTAPGTTDGDVHVEEAQRPLDRRRFVATPGGRCGVRGVVRSLAGVDRHHVDQRGANVVLAVIAPITPYAVAAVVAIGFIAVLDRLFGRGR